MNASWSAVKVCVRQVAELAPALLRVRPLLWIVTVPASPRPGDCQLVPSAPAGRAKLSRVAVRGNGSGGGGALAGVADASLDCVPSPTLLTAATR